MKKRIIALLLCAAMLCGMVLTSGFDASSILADVQTAVAAAETEPEATPAPTAAPLDEVTQIVESVVTATYSETAPVLTGEPENGCYIDSDNSGTFDEDEYYATLDLAIAAANDMTFGEDAEKTVTIEIYGKMDYTNDTAGFTGSYTTINFVGKDTDAEISITRAFPNGENKDGGFIVGSGKNITFKDLILSKSEGTYGDGGQLGYCFSVHNGGIVSYTNCTFPNGAGVGSGTKTTYTGCTFKKSYEKYALWTYGNSVCVVDTCVFDDDRGIKMFSDDDSQENWCDITVKNCDFSKLTGKPAIVLTKGKSVTLQGNTYSNKGVFELEDNGSSNGTIVKVLDVDGNDITATADIACLCENGTGTLNVDCGALVLHEGTYTIYRTIEDAAKVAVSGDTIIALYSTSSTDAEVPLQEGVILNANGHSLPNVTGGVVPVAKIGDTGYSSLQEAVNAAQNGDTITIIKAGTYKLPNFSKNLTISAASGVAVTIDNNPNTYEVMALHGAYIIFNNIVFDYYPNHDYTGLQANTIVYNNCTFNGQVFLYSGKEIFNSCTFNQNSSGAYNVWTYGAEKVDFNTCKFNCAGKSVYIYNEGHNGSIVNFSGCTFVANQAVDGKAAIEIGSKYGNPLVANAYNFTINIDSTTTATGFANGSISGNSLWNEKYAGEAKVYVNNAQVWPMTVVSFGVTAGQAGQTYLFNISDGTNSVNVVIPYGNTVLLKLLPGDYTISPVGNWNWRYSAETFTSQMVTVDGNDTEICYNLTNISQAKTSWFSAYNN